MKKEMLINVLQPEECRIAILEDGVLEELYVERTSHESYVGNIYKGRIVNIEPSIQAAFVDFGVGRNGFLHVSDVEPTYYRHLESRRGERGRRDRDRGRDRDRHRGPIEFDVESLDESLAPLDDAAALLPDEPALEVQSPEEVVEITEEETNEAIETRAEPTNEENRVEPPAAESPMESEAASETEPVVTALPETRIEEEPARRRRSRGRSRSRKPTAESAGEETASEEVEAPSEPEAAEETPSEKPEKPPYMESAERRTTDKEPEIAPSGSDSGVSDEDLLFFPREPEPGALPSPEPTEEPEPEPQIEEQIALSAPVVPPPRARPAFSERRGSIEDELAADLEAAEIGSGEAETQPPILGEETQEIREPFEAEFEAELPAPRQEPRHEP